MHDEAFFIEILTGFRTGLAKIELAIDIVLNKWYTMLSDKVYKRLLLFVGHATPLRVAEVGYADNGFNGDAVNGFLQAIKIKTCNKTR